jgi:DNA topoisomerase-1
VEKEGKAMKPTEVAYKITDMLVKYFTDIMDVGFTAHMEDDLDKIEDGGVDWHKLIADFYPSFAEKLKIASTDGDEVTDVICEKCGSPMIRREGKYGKYLACSNYPKCSNIVSETEAEISQIQCPKCSANMVVKSGKYGKFLACPNYPECSSILPIDVEVTKEVCPECHAYLLAKKGKYGTYLECGRCGYKKPQDGEKQAEVKTEGICPECGKPMRRMRSKSGKIYFGCTGYPDCKFLSWDVPTGKKCPQCGEALVKKNGKVCCSNRDCAYEEPLPPEDTNEN